jgi:hypothetical protein
LTTAAALGDLLEPERLSLIDAAWLHMETPTNLMMVGSLAFFEEPVTRNRLVTALSRRLLTQPRFVERIEPSALGPPRWLPDVHFDLDSHVHSVALPQRGGDGALRAFVSDLMSTPLDMARPLWDAHLVEHHRGGAVLLTRIHHCVADGTALMHVLLGLTSRTAAGSLRASRSSPDAVKVKSSSWMPAARSPPACCGRSAGQRRRLHAGATGGPLAGSSHSAAS